MWPNYMHWVHAPVWLPAWLLHWERSYLLLWAWGLGTMCLWCNMWMSASFLESRSKLVKEPQSMPNVLACLTQADWDVLLQGDLAPHVVVTRLRLCGVASLKEDSKKVCVALLVPSLLWAWRQDAWPPGNKSIRKWGGNMCNTSIWERPSRGSDLRALCYLDPAWYCWEQGVPCQGPQCYQEIESFSGSWKTCATSFSCKLGSGAMPF